VQVQYINIAFLGTFVNGIMCFFNLVPTWSVLVYRNVIVFSVLSKSGKNRHPCPVPDLQGKTVSLSPLCLMLAADFLGSVLY